MPRKSPSLLFVFADQWRGMDLGCVGNADVRTPNLDGFAGEGICLTGACANSPVCGPSRASLLTGLLPTRAGVPGNDLPLRKDAVTFGSLAGAAGLRTAYVGKWHLDGLPRDKFTPPGSRRFGFEHWAAYNCSHEYFRPQYFRDHPEPVLETGYEPEVQTRLSCEFMESLGADESFCLFLSWGPPHDPYAQVPGEYRAMYDPAKLTLRPNVRSAGLNPLARGKDCRETLANYYAAMTALDVQFGRLMDLLERLDRRDDTLVVFTSDHGDMLWSHGWMKKQLPYRESVSIPLLARWPGQIPAAHTAPGLFSVTDFLPTIARLLGWEAPGNLDGLDTSRMWLGLDEAGPRTNLLTANYLLSDEAIRQGAPTWRAIHTRRHTYVERAGGEPWLLFDDIDDPCQLDNLVGVGGTACVQENLKSELAALLKAAHDPFQEGGDILDRLGLRREWERRNEDISRYWQRKAAEGE